MPGGGFMAFWQIRTAKVLFRFTSQQYFWGNNYYTEAPSYSDAWVIASELLAAEKLMYTTDGTYNLAHSYGVHDMADTSRYWYIGDGIYGPGSWVSDGPPIRTVGPCIYVRFGTVPGLRARKWYRVGVDQALYDQGAENASFSAAFAAFTAAFESVRPWLYRADGSPMPPVSGWEVASLRKRHGTLRYEAYAYN